jgi:thioredoxin-related protein
MKQTILSTLLAVVVFAIFLPSAAAAQEISWQKFDQGMAMAKEQDKNVFLYFHAEWCSYCKKMERTTFKRPKVIDYINQNFIAIKVDSDREPKVSTAYNVRGLPTLWFLKSDHTRISNLPGYVDAKTFGNILRFINTDSYERMSYNDFKKTL